MTPLRLEQHWQALLPQRHAATAIHFLAFATGARPYVAAASLRPQTICDGTQRTSQRTSQRLGVVLPQEATEAWHLRK